LIGFLAHRPVFDQHIYPINQTVKIGGKAKFDCKFVTDVEAIFGWNKVINEYNKTTIIPIEVMLSIWLTLNLIIFNTIFQLFSINF